ncbi:hypothetical protein CDAR_40961 [Caerostris darwini]|uniref:Uncharacterized protein n=1 Tax=Caerostris darwini TaxID=1538125 RepID=A0AAV4VF02_9ARAC|nr:hypothetical protein CDAR_40961 [Caerostris darwini]
MSDEGVVPTSLPDEPSTSIFLHPTSRRRHFLGGEKKTSLFPGWKEPPFLHISDGDLVEKGVSSLSRSSPLCEKEMGWNHFSPPL